MKRSTLFLFLVSILPLVSSAQLVSITHTLKATVVEDAQYNDKLSGAVITLEGTFYSASSDAEGNLVLKNVVPNRYVAKVSLIGYETLRVGVDLERGDAVLTFRLKPSLQVQDEVVVSSTRINENGASNVSNIDKEEIEKNNYGQDLPYLLNNTPGVVVSSFNGNGIGYSNITIRGSDNTRTNVTINGIPLNDAESQGMYTVNLPDIASSVDNIQVQRGAGTSTNGAGAFGASINIQTTKLRKEPYVEIGQAFGSPKGKDINIPLGGGKKLFKQGFEGFWNNKSTINMGTGLLKEYWAFDSRLSLMSTEGYTDRGSSQLNSYFVSGGFYGKKFLARFNTFSGTERTYLTFGGVPEAKLRGDTAGLLTHYYNNLGVLYHTAADSVNLFTADNRKYNLELYKDATDNYKQTHNQLLMSYQFNRYFSLNVGLHFTKGFGFYEQFRRNEGFGEYNLAPVILGADTLTRTDLVRRLYLDNNFYGATYNLTYYSKERFTLTIGGAYNIYKGLHYGTITWARHPSQSNLGDYYYESTGKKKDLNVYIKPNVHLTKRVDAFADFQVRYVNYISNGDEQRYLPLPIEEKYTFINPKVGLSYTRNSKNKFFAYAGVANKEPNRDDFFNRAKPKLNTSANTDTLGKAFPESMTDFEIGYTRRDRAYTLNVTAYNMAYSDQLVLTGQVNEVYAPLRTNVSESYRRGLEVDGAVKVTEFIKLAANFAYSQNKIKGFEERINTYDANYAPIGVKSTKYSLTDIAYSPAVIAGATVDVEAIENFFISLNSKYVGKQYLDNTSSEERKLNPYLLHNLRLAYRLTLPNVKECTLSVQLNNFANTLYENGGYTYAGIYNGNLVRENFYYPQAVRNIMFGINAKF